jgi:Threonine synthase
LHKKAQKDFSSARVDDEETLSVIRKFYQDHKYLLYPHSAFGVCAAEKRDIQTPVICLACAHPAKFGKAIRKALGTEPILPDALAGLQNLKTLNKTVPANP